MALVEELLKTRPIKDPYQRALVNMMYNGCWLTAEITKVLKPFDITEPQYNVLRILRGAEDEPMSLYEIQDRMITKMSNVSRLVDKLEEKGFVVRRERDDNRRKVNILITEKGKELVTEIDIPFRGIFSKMSEVLDEQEATVLADLLDKVRYN